MRTGIRIDGLDALAPERRPASPGPATWILGALASLVPLAASTAAAPDAPVQPSTSTAAVELVPLPPVTDTAAPETAAPDAPSAPRDTLVGRGSASYYAARFDGRRTASGERFDSAAMTAAHRTLPFGTRVRVTNLANGRSVIVRINDRGPFTRGRMIDVSRAAASELGLVARGHGMVELALVAD